MAIAKRILAWRRKKSPGAIMKPETFEEIKGKAEAKGKYRSPTAVAGAAYWQTVRAKWRERRSKARARVAKKKRD